MTYIEYKVELIIPLACGVAATALSKIEHHMRVDCRDQFRDSRVKGAVVRTRAWMEDRVGGVSVLPH